MESDTGLQKCVLEPCNINEIDIDIQKLKTCLEKDYLTEGRKEYYESTSTKNIKLEDGFMEFITAKCISGIHVGEGNCPVDVVKNDIGIDVLCVCLNANKNLTNEKSIMQNFKECGNNLDHLFESGQYELTISEYAKRYHKKLLEATDSKNIRKIYYLAYISTNLNVYISVFKINVNTILNITYDNITRQQKSIKIKGFIDETYGDVRLFKSKKRLELRLNKNILSNYNTIKII